jgi:hypothetical protein
MLSVRPVLRTLLPALFIAALRPGASAQTLSVTPQTITLNGPYAEARVLIEERYPARDARDRSADATLTVADPKIAYVDSTGTIRPKADGKTEALARYGRRIVRIPIEARGIASAGPPRFITDVVPVLTRLGCNMGGCHGANSGKGGFKLSLQGYDPDFDFETITRQNGARRIARTQPEQSLLLKKPLLLVPHKGGKRLDIKSPEYRLLRDWIARGMPGPEPTEPSVVRLEVIPAVRTMAVGQTQKYLVRAHYDNGTQRDVTRQTLFSASDESVATVTPGGNATAKGPGEGAILVRYRDLVSTARILSPFNPIKTAAQARMPAGATNGTTEAGIDRLVRQKLDALGLEPSGKCTDSDFMRRAYLDTIGLLPAPDEVRAFLASKDPQKRNKLIDYLLSRPEYVDFWTMRWGDLLRSNRRKLNDKGMYALNNWIRESVRDNKPWNKFAQELLLASGSAYAQGAANYYRNAGNANELAEMTSQTFLGVRIQCARCHNHPYEKWKLHQYYEMSAFFARVRSKGGERNGESVIFTTDNGEVQHPKTQKNVTPCALDAKPIAADFSGDRRAALVNWLTAPDNPFFSRILVNRLWRHFMGRGLVEPVDDLRVTNPPSNAALFDFLAQDFVKHGYDLKHLMRAIMRSETYQRSPIPNQNNARDTKYYAYYPFKRMGAEQLLDALSTATGIPEPFEGYPKGMRAAELPDTTVPSYFLDLFGRPARNVTCECERVDEPNLGQILHLLNNAGIQNKIASKEGRLAKLRSANTPPKRIVEELYLATFSRPPTSEESQRAIQMITAAQRRSLRTGVVTAQLQVSLALQTFLQWSRVKRDQQSAEDLLWALINSKEFYFNH